MLYEEYYRQFPSGSLSKSEKAGDSSSAAGNPLVRLISSSEAAGHALVRLNACSDFSSEDPAPLPFTMTWP